MEESESVREQLRDRIRHALMFVRETQRVLLEALNELERLEHELEDEREDAVRVGARVSERVRFADQVSPGGYRLDEVVSSIQKALRRGQEEAAVFWATELELSGYAEHCWGRLKIVSVEDVADPDAPVRVTALYGFWSERAKKEKAAKKAGRSLPPESRLFLVAAVVTLARARKSRVVDHLYMLSYEAERPRREVADEALDKHTRKGREMGRGWAHFFDEAAQLENESGPDPYAARARAVHSP
jgi:replication-associated recombination protein RarA